jgi:hypothetical protein
MTALISLVKARFLLLLFITFTIGSTPLPQAIQWSSKSYGPDGPWQAVSIKIGSNLQPVDLLPGGSWMSNVFNQSICPNNQVCGSTEAGLYNPSTSDTSFELGQTGYIQNSDFSGTVGALPLLYGNANWIFDTVEIPCSDGVSGPQYNDVILDFDLLVVSSAYIQLPNGSIYTPVVGKLSLGAPNFNQTWDDFPPHANWNGTFLPSSMFEAGKAPSNSYGMHIGSAAMGIPGSLNIGGYDQSRVLGDVSAQAYTIDHLPIDLLDIGIGVAEGQSPFNFTSRTGLLASGNLSIGVSMPVLVEATVPYLFLPQSSCDAIARNLPVTYDPNLGLYLWNTADPAYNTIVSSPSFLAFTFRLNNSVSQNLTINVPFALLNLTLEPPLVGTPMQYFPCSPRQGPGGNYELGRAFLQAAFIGVNWQTGNGVWFLAQAPGPNTPSDNAATTIGPDDNFIVGSTNSWSDTWNGAWTVIDSTSTSPGNNAPTTAPGKPSSSPKAEISKGTITGIVVGVTIGLIVVAVAAFVLFKRQRRNRAQRALPAHFSIRPEMDSNFAGEASGVVAFPSEKYGNPRYGPQEMETGQLAARPVEMSA